MVPAFDCVREEQELVCLHTYVVLENNVGLLVLASEGICGFTDVIRYIDCKVTILDLVVHGESGNVESLLKCSTTQSLSHLCHASLSLIVTNDIPHSLPLYLLYTQSDE